ncbi:type 1 glutamine amidotransferase domain-containing protein [Thermohalobacter berrensis]|uniref:Protease n=1 Tax=Thermohalobacter berrensis TaxID=99594 RepID=A0A419T521_9FIRM|nr:type 1 glutamine amidotransferase domain-containing protein [Thermohalobacter berrensis]RKD32546.1 protease [Thermohalobacter berrensis]
MKLKGKRVVMLAEEGFEDLELWYPVIRLREEGCEVIIAGSGSKSTYKGKYGLSVTVDKTVEEISEDDFDGILVPGGWAPDKLRRYKSVTKLVRNFWEKNKLLATICHGGWVFISAKVLDGYKMTCVNAIIDDIKNAGAEYIDREVVVDRNLITSRTPKDLPAYMREIIKFLETQEV